MFCREIFWIFHSWIYNNPLKTFVFWLKHPYVAVTEEHNVRVSLCSCPVLICPLLTCWIVEKFSSGRAFKVINDFQPKMSPVANTALQRPRGPLIWVSFEQLSSALWPPSVFKHRQGETDETHNALTHMNSLELIWAWKCVLHLLRPLSFSGFMSFVLCRSRSGCPVI